MKVTTHAANVTFSDGTILVGLLALHIPETTPVFSSKEQLEEFGKKIARYGIDVIAVQDNSLVLETLLNSTLQSVLFNIVAWLAEIRGHDLDAVILDDVRLVDRMITLVRSSVPAIRL